jgi:hypothetical protein
MILGVGKTIFYALIFAAAAAASSFFLFISAYLNSFNRLSSSCAFILFAVSSNSISLYRFAAS